MLLRKVPLLPVRVEFVRPEQKGGSKELPGRGQGDLPEVGEWGWQVEADGRPLGQEALVR